MKQALLSVSNKLGIVEFALQLKVHGYNIIATEGTAEMLEKSGIEVMLVGEVTGCADCLDGRVKTLHPAVFSGILAKRDNDSHMKYLSEMDIDTIDLIVVNLSPFKEMVIDSEIELDEALESIDVGGPALLRAAAKNFKDVAVITDPADYNRVINDVKKLGDVSYETKLYLGAKVFQHTSHYDSVVSTYFSKKAGFHDLPEILTLTYERVQNMRNGENSHQKAAFYKEVDDTRGMLTEVVQLHGEELTYNNLFSIHNALNLVKEFEDCTIVICRYSSICGVGCSDNGELFEAYEKAVSIIPKAANGAVLVSNTEINISVAEKILADGFNVVLAPSYTDEAFLLLLEGQVLKVLQLDNMELKNEFSKLEFKRVSGGLLVQTYDDKLLSEGEGWQSVTKRRPRHEEIDDILFSWKIAKHSWSNAVVIAKNMRSIGLGTGQINNENSIRMALLCVGICCEDSTVNSTALEGSVLASDTCIESKELVQELASYGVTTIVQPGGHKNDASIIELCDSLDVTMIFTGISHERN